MKKPRNAEKPGLVLRYAFGLLRNELAELTHQLIELGFSESEVARYKEYIRDLPDTRTEVLAQEMLRKGDYLVKQALTLSDT